MEDNYNALLLRQRRIARKLTQIEVAAMTGLEPRQYQRYETGERKIIHASLQTALAICAVLGIDPYELRKD